MKGYPPFVCPHTITEHVLVRGRFTNDGHGHSQYVAEETEPKEIPCRSTKFEEVGHFDPDSGIDPRGVKVKCLACGQESYIFPAPKKPSKAAEVIPHGQE